MYGDQELFDEDGNIFKTEESVLFTGVPSRGNFGRGFLWDEGFHNFLISSWNLNVTQEIITSWFNTVDPESGWINREQMHGREARSGAPPNAWPGVKFAANPPS